MEKLQALENKNRSLQRKLIVLERRHNHLTAEKDILDKNPSKATLDGVIEIIYINKRCSKTECDKMRKYFSEKYGI